METQELVSKKCEYALRAMFELAAGSGDGPRKMQDIASAQGIPPRFLEVILVELKHAGFVSSRRGSSGGYALARGPRDVTVGEVIGFFEGGQNRDARPPASKDDRIGDFAFSRLWDRADAAISRVYDQTTLEDLVEEEIAARSPGRSNYVI